MTLEYLCYDEMTIETQYSNRRNRNPKCGVTNKAKLGRKENKFNLQAEAICNV